MTATELLRVHNLRRSFGALRAVDDVSFSIRSGEVVSIIGPNGSGKTTTLNLISGLLKPHSGSVAYLGRDITGLSPERVAEAGLTRTFQNGRVFGNSTIDDNIRAGLSPTLRAVRPLGGLRRWPVVRWLPLLLEVVLAIVPTRAVRREKVDSDARITVELGRFGDRLLPRRDQLTHVLSYANRRRTEIARALVAEPALLLLDEPTAGMNPAETDEVLHQLLELKAAGQAMLLVEHKLSLVMTLSDRIIVMDNGVVIAHGTPREIQTDERVLEAYLGRRRASKELS